MEYLFAKWSSCCLSAGGRLETLCLTLSGIQNQGWVNSLDRRMMISHLANRVASLQDISQVEGREREKDIFAMILLIIINWWDPMVKTKFHVSFSVYVPSGCILPELQKRVREPLQSQRGGSPGHCGRKHLMGTRVEEETCQNLVVLMEVH